MRNGKICANVKDYPITPHIITCAYSKQNQNFAIFHREKATNISICAYNRPSNDMIRRQSKINVCKLTRNSVFDTCQGGPNSRGLIVSEGF